MPCPAAGEVHHDHGAWRVHMHNPDCSLLPDPQQLLNRKKVWLSNYQVRKPKTLGSLPYGFRIELTPSTCSFGPGGLPKVSSLYSIT